MLVLLHDLPCAGVPVRGVWRRSRYRCHDTACEARISRDGREQAAPRAMLTTHSIAWAVSQLRAHDIAVSRLVQTLGVAWNTAWDAIAPVFEDQFSADERLAGVNALSLDEYVWRHEGPPGTRFGHRHSGPLPRRARPAPGEVAGSGKGPHRGGLRRLAG
ncbi:hypothetical protein GCM10009696_20700 [Kocuria himachalensis]